MKYVEDVGGKNPTWKFSIITMCKVRMKFIVSDFDANGTYICGWAVRLHGLFPLISHSLSDNIFICWESAMLHTSLLSETLQAVVDAGLEPSIAIYEYDASPLKLFLGNYVNKTMHYKMNPSVELIEIFTVKFV